MKSSLRPVLMMIGVMVMVLSAAMLAPGVLDAVEGEGESASAFFISSILCLFVGSATALANRGPVDSITPRGAFVLTVGSWLALSLCAALPMRLSGQDMSWTNAIFESVSGLTTTGSTVVTGLDGKPLGFLLWRAILQWIGGIGIIVAAIAFWPILRVGGMQLFRIESSDTSDKVLPRAQSIATGIFAVYAGLTVACAVGYRLTGMNTFEAIVHAMTTLSTGGYSTSDSSMGAFTSGGADIVSIGFMVFGALPFTLLLVAAQGKPGPLLSSSQVQAFIAICLVMAAAVTLGLVLNQTQLDIAAWRHAAFNTVSVITGTGYASTDYTIWGSGFATLFFVLTFFGGCSGSAVGGMKIFRLQIAVSALRRYMGNLLRPHAVIPIFYNGRTVAQGTIHAVLGFLFAFYAVFAISAALLSAMGLDSTTALSGAATSLANVGPGLGSTIGPAGTFVSLPDPAKWVLAVNMLIGRLEVFAVLVFFSPRFWRG